MKIIHMLLEGPEFDHYTREYVYLGGKRICEFEYARRWWAMYYKMRERHRKIELEDRLKCIQATEVMNEMLEGTDLSMIHRRLKARNIV